MKLSIIVPCYHEGESVRTAHREITARLAEAAPGLAYEVIFVDDGSRDDTFAHLAAVAAADSDRVRVLRLGANVGSHMAIRAGLEHAAGDHACFLACDLQEPPALIPRLLELCRAPVQVVWAVRDTRADPLTTRLFAWCFYRLARRLVSGEMPRGGASMFLLGPQAVTAVRLYRERNLTLEGLFATMGFPMAMLPYQRQARAHGVSKWTLAKKLKLFADFFTAYSYAPIRLISYLGLAVAGCGFLFALYLLVARLVLGTAMLTGYTTIMITVLVLGGFQMILMGVLGEYIWRTLDEVRARPRYLVEQELGGAQKPTAPP
jgi:dolichol-phosphate mannosyltransferase